MTHFAALVVTGSDFVGDGSAGKSEAEGDAQYKLVHD
tara:strand:- start:434 stop:544 length:111 start_codon:yes stop_codon:yes gene_type:complete